MNAKRPGGFDPRAPRESAPPPEVAPGLAARVAAAQAIADVLTSFRPLEERFSAEFEARFAGLDARDRALARSIATAAFRRLGTIRKAFALYLHKGLPRRAGPLEWILVVAAAQILFLDVPDHAAVDLAVRATRARSRRRSVRRAGQCSAARDRARPRRRSSRAAIRSTTTRRNGSPRAGARPMAKRPRAPSPRPTATSRRSISPSRAIPRAGRGDSAASALPTGSVRLDSHAPIAELPGYAEGEWWVQDAAAALPARLLGAAPGSAGRRSLRRAGRQERAARAAGAKVTAVDRSAERLKRLAANFERLRLEVEIVVADALAFDGAALRRGADRRAVHSDRHDPPPSRRRLDQAAGRSRRRWSSCRAGSSTRRSR